MNSLKQALALMTALHESLSGSQGPAASAEETIAARKAIEMRILSLCLGCQPQERGGSVWGVCRLLMSAAKNIFGQETGKVSKLLEVCLG
jgi:hypothetical protein